MLNLSDLKNFVKENTIGRDSSHGYEHMKQVFKNSQEICARLCTEGDTIGADIISWIAIVAWLHDVADHKYDKDGVLKDKVTKFVYEQVVDKEDAKYVLMCIDMVSFSKEKKEGMKYYEKILPEKFILVRNIVSDADKLEALGNIGLERCETYTRHTAEEKNDQLTDNEILYKIAEHCKEKLFILATSYMRTKPGRKMALYKDVEMRMWLTNRLSSNNKCGYVNGQIIWKSRKGTWKNEQGVNVDKNGQKYEFCE
jgi:HD superfamily phosphodiesterase